jgi:hypothetical protein
MRITIGFPTAQPLDGITLLTHLCEMPLKEAKDKWDGLLKNTDKVTIENVTSMPVTIRMPVDTLTTFLNVMRHERYRAFYILATEMERPSASDIVIYPASDIKRYLDRLTAAANDLVGALGADEGVDKPLVNKVSKDLRDLRDKLYMTGEFSEDRDTSPSTRMDFIR